jgi:hypothetical protein
VKQTRIDVQPQRRPMSPVAQEFFRLTDPRADALIPMAGAFFTRYDALSRACGWKR